MRALHPLRVAVLFGNEYPGDENRSAPKEVLAALDSMGIEHMTASTELADWTTDMQSWSPNVALLTAQGWMGQWGVIQERLEELRIPYVGSGPAATRIAADKALTKEACRNCGIRTPRGYRVDDKRDDVVATAAEHLGWPLVAKPVFGGGSHGVVLVRDQPTLAAALDSTRLYGPYLVEEFIDGSEREYSVGVLETHGEPRALPVCEVEHDEAVFSHRTKFAAAGYTRRTPALLRGDSLATMEAIALELHVTLGCRSFSRTDMIRTDDGEVYVLEVNTLPGLFRGSIFPEECTRIGLGYEQMLLHLIREGVSSANI
jgi:D-alanine-D-alanine ligase